MWPFKKTNNQLIACRYTLDVWEQLNMGDKDSWYEYNCVNDAMSFVKKNVSAHIKLTHKKPTSILIATIDLDYIQWLNKRPHTKRTLNQYVKEKDENYWDNKICSHNMTSAYNVLCVPISILPYLVDNNKTNFSIDKKSSLELVDVLSDIYQTNEICCPGWILKGSDTPLCCDDIISVAEMSWYENKHITIGKYEEQIYDPIELKNKFRPKLFTIPFVVKTSLNHAKINLSGKYSRKDNSSHAMTFIEFGVDNMSRMINILKNNINCVVTGIGRTAMLPGQAYLTYRKMQNSN